MGTRQGCERYAVIGILDLCKAITFNSHLKFIPPPFLILFHFILFCFLQL